MEKKSHLMGLGVPFRQETLLNTSKDQEVIVLSNWVTLILSSKHCYNSMGFRTISPKQILTGLSRLWLMGVNKIVCVCVGWGSAAE